MSTDRIKTIKPQFWDEQQAVAVYGERARKRYEGMKNAKVPASDVSRFISDTTAKHRPKMGRTNLPPAHCSGCGCITNHSRVNGLVVCNVCGK